MKKLFLKLALLLVWVPLCAQTFEKTITISPDFFFSNKVYSITNDDILISGKSVKITYDSLIQKTSTCLIQLNKKGMLKRIKKIKTYEFRNTNISDTTFEYNDFIATYESPNKIKLMGAFRINTNNSFTTAILEVDSNFNKIHLQLYDTVKNHLIFSNKTRKYGNKQYYIQYLLGTIKPTDYYRLLEMDNLGSIKPYSLNDTLSGLSVYPLHDFLLAKNGINYYIGNILDTFQYYPCQLIKLNQTQKVINRKEISYPRLNPNELDFILTKFDASWTVDSNIVLVATGETQENHKGDIHLLLYDTSLAQLNYKRLITHDSLEVSFEFMNLTFDAISNCFYYACVQKFSDAFSRINYSRDTADFRLIKFDKNLNIKFDRRYRRNKTMMMNTLTTDSEGNVIMVGQIQDPDRVNINQGDLYILKVDSLGNFNPIGISEEKIDPLNYAIFPNPAKEQFVFRQYNLNESYELKIYNSIGTLVKEESIRQQEQIIPLDGFKTGVYIYILKDSKNRMISGKLIKH